MPSKLRFSALHYVKETALQRHARPLRSKKPWQRKMDQKSANEQNKGDERKGTARNGQRNWNKDTNSMGRRSGN
jgi:hypothetical protein